jgi:hypothetical protein
MRKILLAALVLTLGMIPAAAAGSRRPAPSVAAPALTTTTVAPTSTTTEPPTTTTTAVPLVPWSGPVEHLFFHTLVTRPDLAFTNDQLGQGFRDYFVTVGEFRAILDQLYANNWTLVDIHRAAAGTVEVPYGRKPLVLSEDDVNYYDYERGHGIGWRLVLDAAGNVKVEEHDEAGIRVTDDDLIPMVDEFVASHPRFSAGGAKGVIAPTGYEGLFGERINDPTAPDFAASQARATAVAARLRATGWTFASHSYGHIDLSKSSLATVQRDTQRWLDEATPVLGPTDVYVYPFGARPAPGSGIIPMLHQAGFTILCDIDVVPRLATVDGVLVMSRRHIDGIAFDQGASRLSPFFDVATVEDKAARGRGSH